MSALLTIYAVILLLIAGLGVAGLYHVKKYSYPGDKAKLGAVAYLAVFGIVLLASLILIGGTDWDTPL